MFGDLKFCFALVEIDYSNSPAGREPAKPGEGDDGIGRQANKAAILKLNFCPTVRAGLEPCTLRDGDIHGGALIATAGINPHLAFHVADTHNAGLRVIRAISRYDLGLSRSVVLIRSEE